MAGSPREIAERLTAARSALAAISDLDSWNPVSEWAARTRFLVRDADPASLDEFDKLCAAPRLRFFPRAFVSRPRKSIFDDMLPRAHHEEEQRRYRENRRDLEETDKHEREYNAQVLEGARRKLVEFIGGLIEHQERAATERAEESVEPAAADHTSDEVFIVHGHDHAALIDTARLLEKLRVKATILHEKPHRGDTLIEKLIRESDVGFAVVLVTPDDRGCAAAGGHDELRPRARQNVVFELGYFIGKLGRDKVCALYVESVELPTDFGGVAWIKLDAGGAWRLALVRELRAAGMAVDANLLTTS